MSDPIQRAGAFYEPGIQPSFRKMDSAVSSSRCYLPSGKLALFLYHSSRERTRGLLFVNVVAASTLKISPVDVVQRGV